jgi:hypothetical protein
MLNRIHKKVKSLINMANGIYPISSIQRRLDNIDEIFTRTVHWMPAVERVYDKNYALKKDHELARRETLKELAEIEEEIDNSKEYLTLLELHGVTWNKHKN